MTHTTKTYQQTHDLAAQLAKTLTPGHVLCLYGELGAGKTSFTKGLASGLGITQTVTSPTFTIVNEYYSGRLPLYHFDLYRIDNPDTLEDTAFFDYFTGQSIIVIEWAGKIEALLQELVNTSNRIDITIEHIINNHTDTNLPADQDRKITITIPRGHS